MCIHMYMFIAYMNVSVYILVCISMSVSLWAHVCMCVCVHMRAHIYEQCLWVYHATALVSVVFLDALKLCPVLWTPAFATLYCVHVCYTGYCSSIHTSCPWPRPSLTGAWVSRDWWGVDAIGQNPHSLPPKGNLKLIHSFLCCNVLCAYTSAYSFRLYLS